jgi:phosphatidylglycerol:prolipoprotein diacylglycerol transferase
VAFCRSRGIDFWRFADLFAPVVPLGFTFGRLGNFLNGELYGRVTQVPWGMFFPLDPAGQLRHPSQLYAMGLEGLLLFAILWNLRQVKKFPGFHLCLYLAGYGIARIVVEFFREPDAQLGLFWQSVSMGQILSSLMIMAAITIGLLRQKKGSLPGRT